MNEWHDDDDDDDFYEQQTQPRLKRILYHYEMTTKMKVIDDKPDYDNKSKTHERTSV